MLIDTHAHLDYPDFATDFDAVLARATEAGVTRILTIGTSIESSRRAVELAEKYPNVFAVIGVHPNYAEEAGEDVITPLRELAKSPRVAAIGETGLDYHHLPSATVARENKTQVIDALQAETDDEIEGGIHDGALKSKQASLFQQQLDLAVELKLNVVIHQRDAWDDTLEVMRQYGRTVSGVFHCFGGTKEAGGGSHRAWPSRFLYRHRHVQKRRERSRGRCLPVVRRIHGRDRLPVSRAGAVPRKTLRAGAHPAGRGEHRGRAWREPGGSGAGDDQNRGGIFSAWEHEGSPEFCRPISRCHRSHFIRCRLRFAGSAASGHHQHPGTTDGVARRWRSGRHLPGFDLEVRTG